MVYGIEHFPLRGNALLRQNNNRIEQYKPNGGVKIKVAIYTRVSTQDQAKEGISLDAQLKKLKLYAESKDYDIYKVYTDAGYTGRNTKRPEYQQMLKDIDNFDGILTYKMDRIHRNRLNFITMMHQLRRKNKEFISMTENLDTSTAIGRFVMGIIQDIAQLESEQIGERVSMAMTHKAENGKGILGFYPPLGYDFTDGKLTVNQQEAKTVQEIFYMHNKRKMNYTDIAKALNNQNTKTKKGNKFTCRAISNITKNPIYCGYLNWNNHIYKNNHTPIIGKREYKNANREVILE